MPYCPSCGKEVQEGEKFCPNCGTSLQTAQTEYTASQTDNPTPNQPDYSQQGETGYTPPASGYSGYDQGGYQQPSQGQYGYQQPPPAYSAGVAEKSPGVALILGLIVGLFLWGIGQIYVGKIMRGIIFLILGLIFAPLLYGIAVLGVIMTGGIGWIILPILGIVFLILWIYQAFDAYKLAQEYNMHVRRTGMPPW
jgi:TM2 domain-containing membrane protein YozV